MTDDTNNARPPLAGRAPAQARRRRVWPWLVAGWLLLLVVAACGAAALLGLADGAGDGLRILVDGRSWRPPLWADGGPGTVAVLGLASALLLVMLVLVLVVPLALLLGLAAAALGIGIALLSVVAVAAVLLSPLWLAGLLLWRLLRDRRPAAAGVAA